MISQHDIQRRDAAKNETAAAIARGDVTAARASYAVMLELKTKADAEAAKPAIWGGLYRRPGTATRNSADGDSLSPTGVQSDE